MTSMHTFSKVLYKFKYIVIFFLITLSFACNNKTSKKTIAKSSNSVAIIQSNGYDSLITSPCALLVYPTLHKIDSMKKKDGQDFYTAADDNQYYMGMSIEYLDSVKAKRIVKETKGTLAFRTNKGQIFKVNLDTLYWDIILFNGKSKPIHPDMTMIQDDYKSYMK